VTRRGRLALVSLALAWAGAAAAAPALVPRPVRLRELAGTFTLTADTVVLADAEAEGEAAALARALGPATGFDLEVATGRVRRRCRARRVRGACRRWIRFRTSRHPKRLGPEGYRLTVRPGGVKIVAGDATGQFRAATTLRQLFPPEIFSPAVVTNVAWTAPAVRIADHARLPWRGMHLDVARSFMPAAAVEQLIDVLALHKVNRLHLHLTDDQGWRVPIAAFPALTAIGGWRAESPVVTIPNGGLLNLFLGGAPDGTPAGGAYTEAEIRHLVQHAAEEHVEIVPEIDMPGHMQAALAALPVLRSVPEPTEVATVFGIQPHVVDVGDAALATLDQILLGVLDLFPGQWVHLGGDEASLTEWTTSANAQARIEALGLADEDALFGWFVGRMAAHVAAEGRRVIVWNDALRDGVGPDVAVMSWLGEEPGLAAAAAGHDVVMTPIGTNYFDHAQARPLPPEEEAVLVDRLGAGSRLVTGLTTDLAEAWSYDPLPAGLDPAIAAHVLGAEGMLWTEFIRTPADVERFAFPRMAAVAERTWSPADGSDFDDFVRRLATHVRRLDAMGVAHWPVSAGGA
jgi:hexosaminidase